MIEAIYVKVLAAMLFVGLVIVIVLMALAPFILDMMLKGPDE